MSSQAMRQRFAMWRCRVLGWHPSSRYELTGFDGASAHARCGRCGYVGLIDSTGALF